jgi:hypothetical protein
METTMTPNVMTRTLEDMRTEEIQRARARRYEQLVRDVTSVTEDVRRFAVASFDAPIATLRSLLARIDDVPRDLATIGGGENVYERLYRVTTAGLDALQRRDAKRLASLDRARVRYAGLRRTFETEYPDEWPDIFPDAASVRDTTVVKEED